MQKKKLINIDAIWKEKLESGNEIISSKITDINDQGSLVGIVRYRGEGDDDGYDEVIVQHDDEVISIASGEKCIFPNINNNNDIIYACDNASYLYKNGNLISIAGSNNEFLAMLDMNNNGLAVGLEPVSEYDPVFYLNGEVINLNETVVGKKIQNDNGNLSQWFSEIKSVNDKGWAIYEANDDRPNYGYNSYLIDLHRSTEALYFEPFDSKESTRLLAINNNGYIVGESNGKPVIYISGTDLIDKGEVLEMNAISKTGDYSIGQMKDVSDSNIIVGQIINYNSESDRSSHAFIAFPVDEEEYEEFNFDNEFAKEVKLVDVDENEEEDEVYEVARFKSGFTAKLTSDYYYYEFDVPEETRKMTVSLRKLSGDPVVNLVNLDTGKMMACGEHESSRISRSGKTCIFKIEQPQTQNPWMMYLESPDDFSGKLKVRFQ